MNDPRFSRRLLHLPLLELQTALKAELASNPFVRRPGQRLLSRDRVLVAPPEALGCAPVEADGDVWLVAVELGHPETVVSLVVTADHTTRAYFGEGGGGVVGPDADPAVRDAAASLLSVAARHVGALSPVAGTPPPEVGEVTVYVRTRGRTLGAQAAAADLVAEDAHPVEPLWSAALALLSALRGEAA